MSIGVSIAKAQIGVIASLPGFPEAFSYFF